MGSDSIEIQYFNHSYRRSGSLWEGRFKSAPVDSDNYLLTYYRYIELNPVRARMVRHPAEYPWSSYRANALGQGDRVVEPHRLYRQLGEYCETRQRAYRSLFDRVIDSKTVEAIQQSTQHCWALGDDRFKAEVKRMAGRAASPSARGGDRRSSAFRRSINGA